MKIASSRYFSLMMETVSSDLSLMTKTAPSDSFSLVMEIASSSYFSLTMDTIFK
jgi:hypothetical protein